jgi:hypothetical protein
VSKQDDVLNVSRVVVEAKRVYGNKNKRIENLMKIDCQHFVNFDDGIHQCVHLSAGTMASACKFLFPLI